MNFKTIALASTALVAIVAVPATAGQYMGKVNLGVGHAWEDYSYGGEASSNFDLGYTTIHGSASVNVPYNDRVNLQFDVIGNASLDEKWNCGPTCGSSYEGFGLGFHLNYKDATTGGIGVFATVGRANVGHTTDSDMHYYAAGLEGEYYCNAFTISAQVGYVDSDSSIWGLVKNGGFVRAGVAYYPSSKLKLAGNVGYLNGETFHTAGASDLDEWNWNFSLEYMFGKSVPVSTYIEYKGQNLEQYSDPSDQIDRHEVRAGVRFYFGTSGDLMKADREGASFESPDVMTWGRHYN